MLFYFHLNRLAGAPLLALILSSLFIPGAAAQNSPEIEVSSNVNPATVRKGATARYAINLSSINGNGFDRNNLPRGIVPRVEGLDISYLGHSTSTQTSYTSTAGAVRTVTLTLNYRIRTLETGTFKIPEFTINIGGRNYRVPRTRINVLDEAASNDADRPPLLELDLLLPGGKIFVGQTLKANLQLYVLDKIPNLRNNYPVKIGDAWAQGKLADSQTRSRGTRHGYNYEIYSRALTLTPIKAGKLDLLYEMEVQALLPVSGSIFDQSQSDDPSPFDDPFFQQFNLRVNPKMQYQNIMVETDLMEIEVHPLPGENQPESFIGAIGEFSLKAFPGNNEVKAGDPITLRVQIAGEGNFDHILPPPLHFGSQWRTYDAETTFRPGDALGISGVKNFDYTLIPLDSSISHIPEITIAYFHPDSEQYELLTTGEIPLTVMENPDFEPWTDPETADGTAITDTDSPPFFELEIDAGTFKTYSPPILTTRTFLTFQLLPFLALFGFFVIRKRQIAREEDLDRKRIKSLERRIQALIAEVGEAARQENATLFYSLLPRGIRLVLSKRLGSRAEAATWDDLLRLVDDKNLEPALLEEMEQCFLEGERVSFASGQPTRTDLLDARARWESLLRKLDQTIR